MANKLVKGPRIHTERGGKITKRRKFDTSCYNKEIDSGRSPEDAMTLCSKQKKYRNVKGYEKRKRGYAESAKPKSGKLRKFMLEQL